MWRGGQDGFWIGKQKYWAGLAKNITSWKPWKLVQIVEHGSLNNEWLLPDISNGGMRPPDAPKCQNAHSLYSIEWENDNFEKNIGKIRKNKITC